MGHALGLADRILGGAEAGARLALQLLLLVLEQVLVERVLRTRDLLAEHVVAEHVEREHVAVAQDAPRVKELLQGLRRRALMNPSFPSKITNNGSEQTLRLVISISKANYCKGTLPYPRATPPADNDKREHVRAQRTASTPWACMETALPFPLVLRGLVSHTAYGTAPAIPRESDYQVCMACSKGSRYKYAAQ